MKLLYVLRTFLFVCLSAAVHAGVSASAQGTAVCNEGSSASNSLVMNGQEVTLQPADAAADDAPPMTLRHTPPRQQRP